MMTETIDILLVEDNPDDVELTMRALKKGKIGNNIYVVRDGEDALDFLFHRGEYSDKKKFPIPGLILLDLNLPKRNGIEILREIKAEPILKRVPVIMLTTSKRDEDIIQSYDLGVNSYIMKPVEFDKFIQTIKNIELYWVLTNTPPLLNGKQQKT
ncbi:MAG: response regulator [Nitrospinae bacterium]|nr:response regulator [Nitrospinota bacterium]MBI3815514.1 response regulator [Nitrospinota bacterium]